MDDKNINSAFSALQDRITRMGGTYLPLNDSNINSAFSALQNRINRIGSAYQSLNERESSLHRVIKERLNPIGSAYQSLNDNSLFISLQDRVNRMGSAYQSLNDSNINSAFSALQNRINRIGSAYKSLNEKESSIQRVINDRLNQIGSVNQALNEQILKDTGLTLSADYINRVIVEAVQGLNEAVPQNANTQYSEALNELLLNLPDISGDKSNNSVVEYINKLPAKAGWMFWLLLIYVVMPYVKDVLNDIAVSLTSDNLKPMIRAYICEKPWATNKVISALICSSPEGKFQSNRFVKVDHLYVRKTPNAKGEIIDLLPRFEPVTLIRKNESLSWSLIRYKNDDGEVMEGWVFSRYLYKPRQ